MSKRLRSRARPMNTDHMIRAGSTRHKGIVYGYTFPSRPNRMKIGYSSRGLQRVREQSTGFPEQPIILFSIHDRNAADLEKSIHQALSNHQAHDVMGTEWFHVTLEDVVAVSPHLRKALGKQHWKSPWRWAFFGLGTFLGTLLLPSLYFLTTPTAQVSPITYLTTLLEPNSWAWQAWKDCLTLLASGQASTNLYVLASAWMTFVLWATFFRR